MIPPGDAQRLADALEEVLADPDLAARMGEAARRTVLEGSSWELPNFENAEAFVARLARRGVIAQDPAVEAVLLGDDQALATRSVQRHFRHATGMTRGQYRQIERARYATNLLRAGSPILEVVHEAGYFDQAHLSHSLRGLIGQTPTSILRGEAQLSFLYKTGLEFAGETSRS